MTPASHTAPVHSGGGTPVRLRLGLVRRPVRRPGSACATAHRSPPVEFANCNIRHPPGRLARHHLGSSAAIRRHAPPTRLCPRDDDRGRRLVGPTRHPLGTGRCGPEHSCRALPRPRQSASSFARSGRKRSAPSSFPFSTGDTACACASTVRRCRSAPAREASRRSRSNAAARSRNFTQGARFTWPSSGARPGPSRVHYQERVDDCHRLRGNGPSVGGEISSPRRVGDENGFNQGSKGPGDEDHRGRRVDAKAVGLRRGHHPPR